jgi:translation initiation factor IF-2
MAELRPPVIAIMGHIDHGKSTLLDYIRHTNTTDCESGGITQHVSAYEVMFDHNGEDGVEKRKITFLDTPGHEAFMGIRARGASAADIAILVVSSEDGVKPQTMEAYKHIEKCHVPYVVAITKIDKPSANIEMAKQSLAENGIYVEGYGGDVPVVAVSAKSGAGVTELLEMLLLVSELERCMGDHTKLGTGVIVESRLDPKKGVTAVGVVKDGTVSKGQVAASTGAVAPLRFILNAEGEQVDSLTFSSPIQIIGWDNLPPVGAIFEIFDDKKAAQFYADSEAAKAKFRKPDTTFDESFTALSLIIKADTAGSLEAIVYELNKLSRDRIKPRVTTAAVGTISEGDVKNAIATPGTLLFGFHTKIDPQAAALAERSGVTIEVFDIIYKLTEKVSDLLTEREPRIEVDEVTGTVKVLKIFSSQKDKQVLGARVNSGSIEKNATVRIMRKDEEIGRGKVNELQQSKMPADSILEGSEFGAQIESKVEICPGDILECIVKVTK